MNIRLQQLERWLELDRLEEVFSACIENKYAFTESISKQIILLSGKFYGDKRSHATGVITDREYESLRADMREALLLLIREMEEHTGEAEKRKKNPSSLHPFRDFIVTGGLVICAVILIIIIPCPTDAQYGFFRILFSVCISGFIASLPSFFASAPEKTYWRTGLFASVFLIVYFSNPALAASFRRCDEKLDVSIRLIYTEPDTEPDFAAVPHGTITLELEGQTVESEIDNNGICHFFNIPSMYAHKTVHIRTDLLGWHFAQTNTRRTAILLAPHLDIPIVPDGSQSTVFGTVRDERNTYLKNVTVRIGQLETRTDSLGRFSLFIPLEYQRESQNLIAYYDGYEIWEKTVYPGLRTDIPIVLKKIRR